MIRSVLYIVTLLFLSSCSRSIYYAFEEKGTYCTLEEKKNGEVIYRAVSKEHYNIESSGFKEYLYVHSPNSANTIYIGIGTGFVFRFVQNIKLDIEDMCFSKSEYIPNKSLVHYSREGKDSLDLLTNLKTELAKEPCFAEHKITWFPPYLKKIKKIDYKKFNLPLKEKYLKTMADKDK